jgi:hypothetical protein
VAALALEGALIDAGAARANPREHHHGPALRARWANDDFRWGRTECGLWHDVLPFLFQAVAFPSCQSPTPDAGADR